MKQEIKEKIEKIKKGEAPKGYKKTEFGVFPSDWCTDKTFKELFEFYGGLGKSRDELSDMGIEYLHYGDLHRNDRNIVTYEEYSMLPKYSINLKGDETFLMEDGDIAFLDASEDLEGTSRAVLIDNPDNKPFIAGLHIIFAKSKRDFLSKYFRQYITIPSYVKKQFYCLSCGFKVYGINRNSLTKIKYAYPINWEEQEKIAEILMKWDKAIELQEKNIEYLEKKKDAVVQRLITKKENWHKEKLSNILLERNEYATKSSGYKHVSLSKEGVVDKTEQYNRDFLVKKDDKKYKIVKPNDVCYNPANLKFGVICINKQKEKCIFSPIYVTYEVNPSYNLDFIGYILCSNNFVKYIRKYEEGTVYERQAVKSLDFLRGEIWIPEKKEQDEIVSIVKKIEMTIDKYMD
ncbi:MAG: restriction endonuclease subunit S, partial [Eubacterium sp.]